MKIGLLGLSGLRAHDPDLLQLGLTLPGVIERGRVVAAMPNLGLLSLAAATPTGNSVVYAESPRGDHLPPALEGCDVVAISALTAQAGEAYRACQLLRRRGVPVVLGGLHASVCPQEALQHADYVVVGEGEQVWPALLPAIEGRSQQRLWQASDFPAVDFATTPTPRYDLLRGGDWNRIPLQTTRGCPWRCDFCASSILLQQPYRKRPVARVLADLDVIQRLWRRPFIELADDNTFVDRRWGRELCRALIPRRLKWFTESDIAIADDEELLALLRPAGCRQLLIGLESPDAADLTGVELKADFKRRRAGDYVDAIRRIQRAGVTVNGCFVLGLDKHGPEIFDRVYEWALEIPLFEVQVTVLTPFPGTPLYERLVAEGRILEAGRWDLCTLFDVNFRPQRMSVTELRAGFRRLVERLYSPDCVAARRRPLLDQWWQQRGQRPAE